jgi:beta-glucosidase
MQIASIADQASVALVFVTSDSGEGYISVDGNEGDRQNLTLWHDGENLIREISSFCNNTIVVISSVGPVLVESFKHNPNVSAILWAALPGQEAGNAIADVLYGRVNPGGKSPFTWGGNRSDYGTDVLYKPNDPSVPQADFEEGIFIDYRAFDRLNITPSYPFGFGLSYTTFSYSNLVVTHTGSGPYVIIAGMTDPAPSYGNASYNISNYTFPQNFSRVPGYIYPYLDDSTLEAVISHEMDYSKRSTDFIPPGAFDSSPQPIPAAGGGPGGNPSLYDVLYEVSATITNTGSIVGQEVVQLYISLGGVDDAKVVLRGFDRLSIQPGQSAVFRADIERRDISSWDTATQNWVIGPEQKILYVGSSSRDLHLSAPLT